MSIKQLSVSPSNVPGAFADVSGLLGREGVNIRAISVADTSDISTVRFVVDDHEKARNSLTGGGYEPREVEPLKAAGINVHCLYPHLGHTDGNAIVILGVDRTADAQQVLADNWVTTHGPEVYHIQPLRRRTAPAPIFWMSASDSTLGLPMRDPLSWASACIAATPLQHGR